MMDATPPPEPRPARDPASELARYRALVPDWDAFCAALRRPLPVCIVANPTRIAAAELCALLRREGAEPRPVDWTVDAVRLPAGTRPGLWWPYQAGLYQIQEEASLLPVHLLDPQPGERVLDLCAAPGGKTAQICWALGNRGTVVANDRDSRRLPAVRDKMKRLGLIGLTTTVHDGGDFPLAAGPFERVLVDAPCSAEGTNFAAGAAYPRSEARFRRWLSGQQKALLRRAAALTRPGGRIVYSTCSFAPEENEAIVDAVLAELGSELRVEARTIPGLDHAPGVTAWNGQCFHPDLAGAVRLWPHRSGTGGFFAVALRRAGGPDATAPAPAESLPPAGDEAADGHARVLDALTHWFALPRDTFAGLTLVAKGHHLQVVAGDHRPPARPAPVSLGVPLTRRGPRWPKPTTAAALLIGRAARRNVVELSAGQTRDYQARRPLRPEPEQLRDCDAHGYVMLRRLGHALGVGLLRPGPPVEIESQFPRAWVPHVYRA